jgi:UDP-glucose 4-epimerase
MSRVLITGGHGFMGRHLAEALAISHEVFTPTRKGVDLNVESIVKIYMKSVRPDVIIHLAANPNNKPNDSNINAIIHDNVLATHNLLYHAPEGCRFIFASSICVYGPTPLPPKEDAIRRPTSLYGATKSACEDLINVYTSQGRVRGVSLRLCATVGTRLTHGILYDFIRKVREPGDYLEVFGNTPGSVKPFLYISDAINSFVYMIDNPYITYPVNIVPQGLLSVKDIAEMLIRVYNSDKEIKWLGSGSVWRGDEQLLQANNELSESLKIGYSYSSEQAMYTAMLENK